MTTPISTIESRSVHETYAEGLRYFMGEGTVNNTLAQLSVDLKANGIDYVVNDAVALMAYGYPFATNIFDCVALSKKAAPVQITDRY